MHVLVPEALQPLLGSPHTQTVQVEFTSRCNLSCVYCAVSQPGYQSADLDLARVDALVAALERRGVRDVTVNGHGETTLVEGWWRIARRLADKGFRLGVITNMARTLTADEVETFARFFAVTISIDTLDFERFRRIRRGGNLGKLLHNMLQIQLAAERLGIPGPRLQWSCVVSDATVFGLQELVRAASRLGVDYIDFCNLTKYPDVPGANNINVNHVATLPPEERARAREHILGAIELMRERRIRHFVMPGLLDALAEADTRPESEARAEAEALPDAPEPRKRRTYTRSQASGETRDCLDPWSMAMIRANGHVLPCCWHPPVGTLSADSDLDAILAAAPMRDLRAGLLTGELPDACQRCPARGWTSVEALQKRAHEYVAAAPGPKAARRTARPAPAAHAD